MARVRVADGIELQVDIDDFLWPWDRSTPVLMMHGFARNATFWRGWIPTVADKHRVFRPELRGMGRSDAPPPEYRYNVTDLMADIVKILDAFKLERVHWVGESSGGLIGMLAAAMIPARIASVVACDSPVKIPDALKRASALGEASAPDAIRKFGVGEWSRRTLGEKSRLDLNHASQELQDWVVAEMDKTPGVRCAANILEFFESADLEPLLPQIKAPLLLLGGEVSSVASAGRAKLLNAVAGARLETLPGYTHGVSVVAAERCADIALRILARDRPLGPL